MDILKFFSVIAEYVTKAFNYVTFHQVIAGVTLFVGAMFVLCLMRTALSRKNADAVRAGKVAKYFSGKYIGTYFDAKRFMKKRYFAMNRRARREWRMFMIGNIPLASTGFFKAMTKKGRRGLELVVPFYNYVMMIAVSVLAAKCIISGLVNMTGVVYVLIPLCVMAVLRLILTAAVRIVRRRYISNVSRLNESISKVVLNNEMPYANIKSTVNESIPVSSPSYISSDKVAESLEEVGRVADCMTKEAVRNVVEDVKDCLKEEDRAKYDDFLSKLSMQEN